MAEDPLAPKSAAVARPPSALSHQSSEVTSPSRGSSSKGGSPPLGGSPAGMRRQGSLTLSGGASEDADEHDQAGKTMFWFFHGSFSAPIIKLLLHVTVVALVHVFYAFTLVNWRCSRDDAAETAAAAAVDAAAGLTTAPGLASPVVSSPTEEIQVKCERSSTLTFFYLLSCVYLTLSAKQIRHGTIGRVSDIAPSHCSPTPLNPSLPPPQATHSFSRASRSRAPDRGSASFCSTGVCACPSFGRRERSSTGRSRRRRSTSGAG